MAAICSGLSRPILLITFVAMNAATSPAAATDTALQNVPPRSFNATVKASEAQRSRLLEAMLSDPTDLDTAFEYATLSSRAGEVEAAISTLERLLMFAPDVARLRYELGVLYFRLGSYFVAEQYFSDALSRADLPDRLRVEALRYSANIDKETAPSVFNGSIAFGTRFQSNANGGASNPISAFLGNYLLPRDARSNADVNAYLSGQFHYSRELPSQGDRLEADLAFYGTVHAEQSQLNTGIAELTFGPDFDLGRVGLSGAGIGLYGVLGGVVLDGNWYGSTVGAGVRLHQGFTATTRGELSVEYRRQVYRNSATRLASTDRNGHRIGAQAKLSQDLTDRLTVYGIANAVHLDARKPYQSFLEIGGVLGITYRFDSPFAGQEEPWTLDVAAGTTKRVFDVRDPLFTVTTPAEKVTESFIRGSLAVPLDEKWTVEVSTGYSKLQSNYDFHSHDNIDASLGFRRVF
ncbi:tetratricopeptide repeat protein [Hoeflea sp. AS60]|uniref:tetratricopeptide repeat protein n=1 Tax=Hoeflea sp. AS60 TaxID=3135780 RepID=UPI00317FDB0F